MLGTNACEVAAFLTFPTRPLHVVWWSIPSERLDIGISASILAPSLLSYEFNDFIIP